MMPTIANRRELARHLQEQMAAAKAPWSTEEEEVPGRTSVKTYLIEAHAPTGDPKDSATFLRSIAKPLGFFVRETEDSDLLSLQQPLPAPKEMAEYWCDTSLGRFWRLHTTARVDVSDKFALQLTNAAACLDRVWLPPAYLRDLSKHLGGRMRTFSLSHDRRGLTRDAAATEDLVAFTMRLWASNAEGVVRKLRKTNLFEHGLSMRSVRVESGDKNDASMCIAEYFHDGKITVTGESFDEHNRLLLLVLTYYRGLVEAIEDKFAVGWRPDANGHRHLCGRPIDVELEWTVRDLEYAVSRIFSSGEPFRLCALPERVSKEHYRAFATDLHVGGTLKFDITPKSILIQLPVGTCGNTVVRFLGNLQYNINADAIGPFAT